VSLLIRPLVADLAGQLYDAEQLADRMAKAYGLSLPSAALEAFTSRLLRAQTFSEKRCMIEFNSTGSNELHHCQLMAAAFDFRLDTSPGKRRNGASVRALVESK
jgi:hypothetical protein